MELILMKLLDNFISSCKSLSTHELKPLRVFIFSFIKSVLFFFVVKVTAVNDIKILIIASIFGGFGSSLPVLFKSKNRANIEEIWEYRLTCESKKTSKNLADQLRRQKIDIFTSNGYNTEIDKVLIVNAIAHCSKESKIIMNTLPKGCRVQIRKDIESFVKK